ncbi:hypothetical protein AK812_SmicGene4345 [Symbiodinium microadriaticum]|uniref:Uncharacterized protein n=1 Tax=Symbiodinium microadriaticum TaxID=2951 RepID=A0A1Q9EWJ1_SYMMI|nr:hypothetical protein AK812_SmicGene4345 [Symbiodinium microadriaticum]
MHRATAFIVVDERALKGALSRERHGCRHKVTRGKRQLLRDMLLFVLALRTPKSLRKSLVLLLIFSLDVGYTFKL